MISLIDLQRSPQLPRPLEKPQPPTHYPRLPICFLGEEIKDLEAQYEFYRRCYPHHSLRQLHGQTRLRVTYIIYALGYAYSQVN